MIPSVTLQLLATCASAEEPALQFPTFTDVTQEAGIRFRHRYGDHDLSNIVEGTGPGCAFFDYDGDGNLDIYLVNGCWLKKVSDNQGRALRGKLSNVLYRNKGDGTFVDVTAAAKVGDQGFGMGVSAADYDGDGDVDLYVLNYGANVLYENQGDGTFEDVSRQSGLADPRWSLAAPWLDYDGDGDLDVYVVNYLEYDEGRFRDYYPAKGYPGPLSYKGQGDRLFRNEGDGTFTEVTAEAGLTGDKNCRGMSAVACDLDGDGRRDIYVANDATPNYFYVAGEGGTFKEKALIAGLAFGEGGQGASSMGPAVGDVDRDGQLDVYVPDMGYGCLLVRRGKGFDDATTRSRLALACGQYTGWGSGLADFDNDGWLDLFVANGNAHHEYGEEDVLVRNLHDGTFGDVATGAGAYFADSKRKLVGRGAAVADYDNDGDMDILVMALNGPATLLRNDGGNAQHWLKVDPVPTGGGPTLLGARVSVHVGRAHLVQEVVGASGYLSQGDLRPHFGLGGEPRADRVVVRWPDGASTVLEEVNADRILVVEQPTEPTEEAE